MSKSADTLIQIQIYWQTKTYTYRLGSTRTCINISELQPPTNMQLVHAGLATMDTSEYRTVVISGWDKETPQPQKSVNGRRQAIQRVCGITSETERCGFGAGKWSYRETEHGFGIASPTASFQYQQIAHLSANAPTKAPLFRSIKFH